MAHANAIRPFGSDPREAGATIIPGIDAAGDLYPIEKMAAHREPILHLAVSVFVFAGDELLIQRRAAGKYHCPGQWANTCCTHPHWGEDIEAAARRRLGEELGFEAPLVFCRVVDYQAAVGNGLWEHERVHMFRADVDRETLDIEPNPAEVCETRWITPNALNAEIAEHPERFTPWFRIYLDRFPDLKI